MSSSAGRRAGFPSATTGGGRRGLESSVETIHVRRIELKIGYIKTMLSAGTIVDFKYEIVSTLGVGGFGAVYAARQINLDRIVALKIIHEHQGLNDDALARFEREAQTMSRLRHKNLALFYGYGRWEDAPYMVLELVRGKPLASLIQESGALTEARTIALMKQVCDALTCIHSNGIVHRDLKPGNIMIVEGPDGGELVKLIDFGLAKIDPTIGERMQRLTQAGSTVGSAEYMSPEQCMGLELDGRSDIYSLGCTMQACLTGQAPFVGEHSVVVMQQHIYEPPPQLQDLLQPGTYSNAVQLVLNQALAKEREKRYETAEEFRADLAKASGRDTTKMKASAAGIPTALDVKFARKKKVNVALLAVAAACVSAVGFFAYQSQQMQPKEAMDYTSAAPGSSLNFFRQASDEMAIFKFSPKMVELYEKALAQNKIDHLLTPDDVLTAQGRLSHALVAEEDYDKAKQYLDAGMDKRIADHELNVTFIEECRDAGKLYSATGLHDEGIMRLERAAQVYRKQIGKLHPEIGIALARVYNSARLPEKALAACAEVSGSVSEEDKFHKNWQQENDRAKALIQLRSQQPLKQTSL